VLRDVSMATNFGTKIAINWLCVDDIVTRQLIMKGVSVVVDRMQICRYPAPKGIRHCRYFHLEPCACFKHFCLSKIFSTR